jgi:hypothetical protein
VSALARARGGDGGVSRATGAAQRPRGRLASNSDMLRGRSTKQPRSCWMRDRQVFRKAGAR